MRKFKFRIWHKKENRWLDPWAEEDPIISLKDFGYGCNVFLYDREDGFSDLHCQMEDLVIQQFTGLKDINGEEIYEGDIVEWQDSIRNTISRQETHREEITFSHGVFWASLPLYEINKLCKVIGNIFEDKNDPNNI